ncbi:MAG: PilZ domain-containing protein [Thermodesulfobacteriota bacterium]
MYEDGIWRNGKHPSPSASEQRAYVRKSHSAPILYEFYNTNNYYQAVMRNHSMGGMCFEAEFALPKGVEIYIKIPNHQPGSNGPEARKGYRAEVRWCRRKNGTNPPSYEVGVNYFEPVLF